VHREIYRELRIRNPDDPLIEKVNEAFTMGKKLVNKLRQYKHGFDRGWWEANKLAGGEVHDQPKPGDASE
jgi:hypothetical protein